VFSRLRNREATQKLFDVLGPRFKERPGGYCRILKLSKPRLGDNGQRAIREFVERTPAEEPVEAEA
jgi:large subunit ribosomal protein L17